MLIPNPNLAPPGGYYFVDSSGVRFEGPSWGHVHSRIREYREANGIPVGDVEAEVAAQFCKERPHLCVKQRGPRKGTLNGLPLYTSVLGWLADVFTKLNQRILSHCSNRKEIQRRSEICARCKFQVAWREHSGCRSCLTDYQIVQKEIMRGIEVIPASTSLQGCRVLAEDTSVSIYVNQPPSDRSDLPEECWRKK
jgi:hypothetical protein